LCCILKISNNFVFKFLYFCFEGSPFHPKIIDPNQVEVVVDCPENWTAVDRLMVPLDELYSILFDCAGAGPGACTEHPVLVIN